MKYLVAWAWEMDGHAGAAIGKDDIGTPGSESGANDILRGCGR